MDTKHSKETIKELIYKKDMLLLYFGSQDCNVCTALKPKVREMLKAYPNIENIEIDVEKDLELSANFNIFTIPSVLLFIEGKEIIREARHISIDDISKKIERYYSLFYEE